MLRWRIAVSAILIPALVGIFYLDALTGASALWLLLLAEALALRSVWEINGLLEGRSRPLQLPLLLVCSAGVVFAAWIPHLDGGEAVDLTPAAITFALSIMLLFAVAAARFQTPGGNLEALGLETLVVGYAGFLLAVTVQLRWVAGAEAGYLVLGSLLVCAKGGDVGAFTLGKLLGRRKMAPRLSPGKTWAGAVGAVLGASLCGWLWLHFAPGWFDSSWSPPAWYFAVLYGGVIGIVGLVGDLCESLLKRDTGKKDSAALFPGFGGLLDLLDSVLYAGPAALLLWMVLPLAPWNG